MRRLLGVMLLGLIVSAPVAAQTDTPTETPTVTPTVTVTNTRTATPANTFTPTRTLPPTRTITPTRTPVNTSTPTRTPIDTFTATPTTVPTGTKTPIGQAANRGNSGCLVLNATPVAVGTSSKRLALTFWAADGPLVCGYNANILPNPGATTGALYETGRSLSKCVAEDLELFCLAQDGSGMVCWDEVVQSTPTVTSTPTITPTPA